jgi:hypothetical protein
MKALTNGVGTKHWLEASKDWHIYAYILGCPVSNLTEGLSSKGEINKQEPKLEKATLKHALRRESTKTRK